MKKILLFITTSIILVTIIFAGCSTPEPAPAPAPTPTPEPVKTINLRAAVHSPDSSAHTKLLKWWGEEVEKVTNGQIKITLFSGGTLVSGPEQYNACVTGLCEVSDMVAAFNKGMYDLYNGMLGLPFMVPNSVTGAKIINELVTKYPEMMADAEGEVKPMFLKVTTANVIHTSEKQIRTLEDMEGVKIGARSPALVSMVQIFGGVPVDLSPADTYMAIDKGVVDGVVFPWGAMIPRGLHEVCNYHTDVPLAAAGGLIIMNANTWNSLPANLKKAVEDVNAQALIKQAEMLDAEDATSKTAIEEAGNKVITISGAELGNWISDSQPLIEEWITDMEGKGHSSARNIVNDYKLLLAKNYK